jgi:uncharacterized membrane protein
LQIPEQSYLGIYTLKVLDPQFNLNDSIEVAVVKPAFTSYLLIGIIMVGILVGIVIFLRMRKII